ncbi:CoA transferase [bacterium]|nr:CoA transferase [bacterium]
MKPLKGITIIDLSRLLPGPMCTYILATMGAKVIKVEDTGTGDYLKTIPPFLKNGQSALYQHLNGNKKISFIDYKSEKGRSKLLSLIKKADVVVESFRPGAMDHFKLSFKDLKKINPKIILASITGYGQKGKLSQMAGHDMNFMGYAGLLDAPHLSKVQWADIVGGGVMGAFKIVSSLVTPRKNRKAQHLDIAMVSEMLSLSSIRTIFYSHGMDEHAFTGLLGRYRIYETLDGKFVAMGALEEKFWNKFCTHVGKTEWMNQGYIDASPQVCDELKTIFKSKTRDEWEEIGLKLDCCLSPILAPGEYEGG